MSGDKSASTARALGVGILLGACLATANVYMGLKTGWWESGGVVAALAAFLLLRRAGSSDDAVTATVISQAAASSAAAMPAAVGLLGAIPALTMLGHDTSGLLLVLWGVSLGVFGLLIAIVFREPLLVTEALPFPSGTAIAETIKGLRAGLTRGAARAPLMGALVAALVTWFRDGVPSLIPATTYLPLSIVGLSSTSLTLGIAWSPLLFGIGILVGLRNGLGLLAGAAFAWGVLAPLLVQSGAVEGPEYAKLMAFLLWPGVALMVSAGLTSLVWEWRSIVRALKRGRHIGLGSSRIRNLLIAAALAVVLLAWWGFGIHPAAAAVVLLASILAALVCTRSVGETGIAPLSQLGQLTQVGYGALSSGAPQVNVAAASVVAGSIVQTAQTMESFRVGQLMNVSPAHQVRSAGIGIVLGTLVALPVYLLVTQAYGIGTANLPAPGAVTWKAMAELIERGAAAIPNGAAAAAVCAFFCGAALQVVGRTRFGRVLPSPLVLGVAFLVPAYSSAAIGLGSILGVVLARRLSGGEAQAGSLGAGAIAGESILGVILAALVVSGVLGH